MPAPEATAWDAFAIALIATLIVAIPVMTYVGSARPVGGAAVEGFVDDDNDADNDDDSDDDNDDDDDDDDDDVDEKGREGMRQELREALSILDDKHAKMMKKVLRGDTRPETMKRLYKNNMLPHDAIDMVVDRRIEKFFGSSSHGDSRKRK